MRTELSDEQLLDQLRLGSSQGFDQLYRRYYPSIAHFVVQNKGSYDQAQDLFQETLMVLLTAVRDPDFTLTSSLKTYVFAISKNLWLKQLKKSSRWTDLQKADDMNNVTTLPDIDAPLPAYERVMAIFAKLTIRCVTLLSAIFFGKQAIADIVRKNKYASVHSAQNQKYKCLQQARKAGRQASE